MNPLLFFALGIPLATGANYLIRRLTEDEEDVDAAIDAETEGRLAAKRLPWHLGAWPSRVRLFSAASIPVLCALAGWRFDALQAVAVSLLVSALIVCTATDLMRYRVPNAITYPSIVLALVATLLMPHAHFVAAVAAAGLGGGCFLFMAILTRGGIGLGDVKLAVLIGAALGFPAAYQALAFGIVAGGIVIFVLFASGVVGRRQAVPYAPFLALAAVAMVFMHGAAFAPL